MHIVCPAPWEKMLSHPPQLKTFDHNKKIDPEQHSQSCDVYLLQPQLQRLQIGWLTWLSFNTIDLIVLVNVMQTRFYFSTRDLLIDILWIKEKEMMFLVFHICISNIARNAIAVQVTIWSLTLNAMIQVSQFVSNNQLFH